MAGVLADTHAIIWYLLQSDRLSQAALNALVRYLVERGRVSETALERLEAALTDPDAVLALAPLDLAVTQAVGQIPRDVVPDMPDRIIAATALYLKVPLITRDTRIRAAGISTIW